MMTEMIKGRTRTEAERLFARFHQLVAGAGEVAPGAADLGKLAVFSGVRDYPARIKCATLVWHALHSALGEAKPVSTE
jgi:nitrogen fixation NifU-like protein